MPSNFGFFMWFLRLFYENFIHVNLTGNFSFGFRIKICKKLLKIGKIIFFFVKI